MAGMAQGAVDSLLGRLTALLVDEAQLLGGVRGDVEFIKDEMEFMNGLLLHLTEAQHREHQVRAWMKQVVGLARDCEAYVELYVQSVVGVGGAHSHRNGDAADDGRRCVVLGVVHRLRRLVQLLRTVPARHRVATRIRELKVRARDVGDRRLRYGVTVPSASEPQVQLQHYVKADDDDADADLTTIIGDWEENDDARNRRWALLAVEDDNDELVSSADDGEESVIKNGIDLLRDIVSDQLAAAAADEGGDHHREQKKEKPGLNVFPVVFANTDDYDVIPEERYSYYYDRYMADRIAEGVYDYHSKSMESSFDFSIHSFCSAGFVVLLQDILKKVPGRRAEVAEMHSLADVLQGYLRGKRFLIHIEQLRVKKDWDEIRPALLPLPAEDGCTSATAGSESEGIVITTTDDHVLARELCPHHKILRPRLPRHVFYYNKAEALTRGSKYCPMNSVFGILKLCRSDAFAMKMFLHLLYINPNRTRNELHKFHGILSGCVRLKKSIGKQMVMFCYEELPSGYRKFLLYLAVFPKGHIIKRTWLARRWIADGLIAAHTRDLRIAASARRDRSEHHHHRHRVISSMDEAEHYFDALFTRGFLQPHEMSSGGKIKSCTVHRQVHVFIARVARDVNFVDTRLAPELAQHLSIHNGIGLHSVLQGGDRGVVVAALLPSMAASSQWKLLKVLDLQGCKGLNKKHLNSICEIVLLKYLSFRDSDVVELPKQIDKLQCLETLDIRQTKVRALPKKHIFLPMLKHFLAGCTPKVGASDEDATDSEATVPMVPFCNGRMKNMEVLCHVQVSHSGDELDGIAQLEKLRKLGVVLRGCKNAKLIDDLLHQIGKMHGRLRSLSIRMADGGGGGGGTEEAWTLTQDASALLQTLQSLHISGIRIGLHQLIQDLHHLAKIVLTDTCFKEGILRALGKLRALRGLKLGHKSYTESEELSFKSQEFLSLRFLEVKGSDITRISFDDGAAPMLESIVWSFTTMDMVPISGIRHLSKLRKVELNGACNQEVLRKARLAVFWHPNEPVLKLNVAATSVP